MSIQFGRWNFDGQPPAQDYIDKISATLAPYGPDSNEAYSKAGVTILYRAFHTTKESCRETQPHISRSGAVITWDGRLDNRNDLISELRDSLTTAATDVAIVAASYEKWGVKCLGKLIGDWALSLWNPREHSVLLAKDPIGTRHLCYSFDHKQLTWSTILDPLVLSAGRTFKICEEYIAGWFSYFPAAHLTPYLGIQSVAPSSYVLLRPGKHTICKYWDFDPNKKIRYRADAEYEEHFRNVFTQAVQRRLRSDRPVLAELSGGLDSASIVCIADTLIARGASETSQLDTISWFDDSYDQIEPDSNELHWITKVEEKRGRGGCHIDLHALHRDANSQHSLTPEVDKERFAATPRANLKLCGHFEQYAAHMQSHGLRVTLSGIGGDEVTSGELPTPTPELQNLLARGRFVKLGRQLNAWAIKMRKPRLPLLREAARGFFACVLTGLSIDIRPAFWLHPAFVRRNYAALCAYPARVKLFGCLPSFQQNLVILNVLRRLLASWSLQPQMLREVRLPYLDRDFLEYLYAIPREQIVGVGKRRFLMRRALVGIVPDELLNRRRKAFVPQEPKTARSTDWPRFIQTDQDMISDSIGITDQKRFEDVLYRARSNDDVPNGALRDTLMLESWLSHLAIHKVLTTSRHTEQCYGSPMLGP